jgi:hypothetical protein
MGCSSLRSEVSFPKPLDGLGKSLHSGVSSEKYAYRSMYQTEQLSQTGRLMLSVSEGAADMIFGTVTVMRKLYFNIPFSDNTKTRQLGQYCST